MIRVNVESDGSMGAIATSLRIDGVDIRGPYLKGAGTAWVAGVSASSSKSTWHGMPGRFQIEQTGATGMCMVHRRPSSSSHEETAEHTDVNPKYNGSIGVLIHFLGPYEPSNDEDGDNDIEVYDNAQFPDTKRGCPEGEGNLRMGCVGLLALRVSGR